MEMKFRLEAGVATDPLAENSSYNTIGVIHDLCCHARCAVEVVRGRAAAEPGKLV